jgi:hypothetical protein
MTLMKRASNVLFTVAAAGAVVGLAAAPALASTTLTVKVTNGGTYTATASKTVFSNTTTAGTVSVTCTSTSTTPASKGTGSVPTATTTGTSPVKIGTVGTLAFNNCTGPLGAVTTKVNSLPYSLKVDSTTNSTGQTDGMITGINVHVSMNGCSFNVTGSSPGFYSNGTHQLTMTTTSGLPIKPLNSAALTVNSVSGCFGLVNNGNHPTFKGVYTVSRAIVIKST